MKKRANNPNYGSKKSQLPAENIIFLAVNALVFAALLIFIGRAVSDNSVIEEATAKKLALIIDGMKPGMEVNLSMKELYGAIEKNGFADFPVRINGNTVNVKVLSGSGYSFQFFSDVSPVISIDKNDKNKILTIKT